jgi:hypothetical protein
MEEEEVVVVEFCKVQISLHLLPLLLIVSPLAMAVPALSKTRV